MKSADEAIEAIRYQTSLLPAQGWTTELKAFLGEVERIAWPHWPPVRETLCRSDPGIRNFVRRAGPWLSVDWEYSGWCDPAFEIADLLVHPSYASVPESRWEWVILRYCGQSTDPGCEERIRVYGALMLVWWRVRMARYLFDAESEATRLAPLPLGWREEKEGQLRQYHHRGVLALQKWG